MTEHPLVARLPAVMVAIALSLLLLATTAVSAPSITEYTQGFEKQDGFFPLFWDAEGGRLLLEIPEPDRQFLYLPSVASGLGDRRILGLDKGTPGEESLARFERVGRRVHLVLENTRFRSRRGSEALARTVADSFPTATLASFDILADQGARVLIDATAFFLSDVIDVRAILRRAEEGSYELDDQRSRIFLPRTRAFPDNTEVEALLTFASDEPGDGVRRLAPDARSLTLRLHHSFVKLPSDGFRPRRFDPRIGVFPVTFYDFSKGFDEDYVTRYAVRHRLTKVDPAAPVSEPVEPIIYYLDPAIPEPYRSAFKEGAGWWNREFEDAGFKNAFRVEDMPEGMDPLDARYHVIQWFHRSANGSSVGPSFVDPRTGEIIKAVVRMDSHRSLANYDLYAAMLPALLADGERPSGEAKAFTMARRRQHAAHEVGHTLGLAHNFAAAFDGRASVMAYPAPLVRLVDGRLDLSEAYRAGPGAYDSFVIRWSYTEFPPEQEAAGLETILEEMRDKGLKFITNPDQRAESSFAEGSTWVNGSDAVDELARIMELRRVLVSRFDAGAIRPGEPLSLLNRRFASAYLFHSDTLQAAIKAIGGMEFRYAVRGEPRPPTQIVEAERQKRALELALDCLEPEELAIPETVLTLLAPPAFGHRDDEHAFDSPAAPAFDQLAAARALASEVLTGVLAPPRAARVVAFANRREGLPTLEDVIEEIVQRTWGESTGEGEAALRRVVQRVVVDVLIDLAANGDATPDVRASAEWGLKRIAERLDETEAGTDSEEAHRRLAGADIERFLTDHEKPPAPSEPLRLPAPLSLGDDVEFCSFR